MPTPAENEDVFWAELHARMQRFADALTAAFAPALPSGTEVTFGHTKLPADPPSWRQRYENLREEFDELTEELEAADRLFDDDDIPAGAPRVRARAVLEQLGKAEAERNELKRIVADVNRNLDQASVAHPGGITAFRVAAVLRDLSAAEVKLATLRTMTTMAQEQLDESHRILNAHDVTTNPSASLPDRIVALLAMVKRSRDYLDKIRGPLVETEEQKAARDLLSKYVRSDLVPFADQSPMNKAIITVLDDLNMWRDAYLESLEKTAKVEAQRNLWKTKADAAERAALDARQAQERAELELSETVKERDRWRSEHGNATRLLNEQSEAIRKAGPKPIGLSETIQRMNDVITAQLEATGSNSTLARAADIRRHQSIEFSFDHDREHGWSVLSSAAKALMMRNQAEWPWDQKRYAKLATLPLHTRLAHAAALICAAGDVAKAEGL